MVGPKKSPHLASDFYATSSQTRSRTGSRANPISPGQREEIEADLASDGSNLFAGGCSRGQILRRLGEDFRVTGNEFRTIDVLFT
jgi:hypothetical protein